MRKRQVIKPAMLAGLVAMAALVLAIVPTQVWAVDCSSHTADSDGDGFSDYDECQPFIVFPNGVQFSGLNPNVPDLFVILTQDLDGPGSSLIPPDLQDQQFLLEFFSEDEALFGVGITTHVVNPLVFGPDLTQSDLRVCPSCSPGTQKAVWISESLDVPDTSPAYPNCDEINNVPPNEMPSGVGNVGTPNDAYAGGTVYTKRIKWRVDCSYSPEPAPEWVLPMHIKHTYAHELAHNVHLRYLNLSNSADKREYNKYGAHYSSRDVKVMSQSTYYTDKGNKITWYIGTDYVVPPDPEAARTHLK